MKFRPQVKWLLIVLLPFGLLAEDGIEDKGINEEGFKTSTISNFLSTKYKWEKTQPEAEAVEVENETPLKPIQQKEEERLALIQARIEERSATVSGIQEEESGLDTVDLKEFRVTELYSPLMRMSEIKNLDVIDPASGGRYLSESYYSDFENNILNRWTIPLIGRSQEDRAKEKYRQEQFQSFLAEAGKTLEHLDNLDPEYAKQVRKEFSETQHQYNVNEKTVPISDGSGIKF